MNCVMFMTLDFKIVNSKYIFTKVKQAHKGDIT